jgi:protoporphyrinogen oxidase
LASAGVSIRLNDEVTKVRRSGERYCLSISTRYKALFDKVISGTGNVSALPDGLLLNLPIHLNIK